MTIFDFLIELQQAKRDIECDSGISMRLEAVEEHVKDGDFCPAAVYSEGWRCGYSVDRHDRKGVRLYVAFEAGNYYGHADRLLSDFSVYPKPILSALRDCFNAVSG